MTDELQFSQPQRPKSLLETHRDAGVLIQALNEYAASHQKPSIPPDPPKSSTQGTAQDPTPITNASANSHANSKPKEKTIVKESGPPVANSRRKPAFSEQPSISKLSELGVKVRDFAYESTLPPVPTVYLQPRQIQPSVPKDVNDPNDLHYVLEEERKKKAYSFESTRKIQRTPTEPMLESDLLPPPRRTFPKIQRTDALFDLGSQFDSQPQSLPMPSHPTLPYDITNTPQPASQSIPGLTIDSQQTEPCADTPIVTPVGSVQWPENPTSINSTALPTATTQSQVATSNAPASMASQMNSIATSDSQLPPELEPMSYSQMGFTHPDSQALILDGSAAEPSMPISQSHEHLSASIIQGPSPRRALTPTDAYRRAESIGDTPLAPTSPLTPSPISPHVSYLVPPTRSAARSPRFPAASPSKLPLHPPLSTIVPASTSAPTSPRYNLRDRNKRRAESPPPTSLDRRLLSRQKTTRSQVVSHPNTVTQKIAPVLSVNSVHLQNKADLGVVSTGRTLKRSREGNSNFGVGESVSTSGDGTRRKRRNKAL